MFQRRGAGAGSQGPTAEDLEGGNASNNEGKGGTKPDTNVEQRTKSRLTFATLFAVLLGFEALNFFVLYTDLEEKAYKSTSNTFDIVINSFKRESMLSRSIAHYSSCKSRPGSSIDTVYVVSPENETPKSTRKKAIFATPPVGNPTSLNNRFLPLPAGGGRDVYRAVFSVDDDVLVSCKSLKLAFDGWRARPESMVGFFPRSE